ncbi:MAG: iron-sulfur cluster assembly protein [Candidatus Pacebacteria bacterium]|nr:iron-sulfur cluster assembly protein [Candidatus Paceibacterota bacterium]
MSLFDQSDAIKVPPPPQQELREAVREALSEIFDPEIPVNIVELGLIYALDCDESGLVKIEMTLTAPNCPVAEDLPIQVRSKAMGVAGVTDATVELVWTPPWTMDNMTEAAKLQLGMM